MRNRVDIGVWVLKYVIVRVSIIWDQGASMIVAGQLHLGCVNSIDRGKESATLVHDHSLVLVKGSHRELRVNGRGYFDVATNLRKRDSMCAMTSLVGWIAWTIISGWIDLRHKVHVMIAIHVKAWTTKCGWR